MKHPTYAHNHRWSTDCVIDGLMNNRTADIERRNWSYSHRPAPTSPRTLQIEGPENLARHALLSGSFAHERRAEASKWQNTIQIKG
jgi:hypothetical protein